MPAYSIDGLTRFTQVGKTHPEQWFVFIDDIMNGDAVNPGLEFFIIDHYSRIPNIRLTSQTVGTESHTDRSYRELLSFIIIDNRHGNSAVDESDVHVASAIIGIRVLAQTTSNWRKDTQSFGQRNFVPIHINRSR